MLTYYVPSPMLSARNKEIKKTIKTISAFKKFSFMEEINKHKNIIIIVIDGKGVQKEAQNTEWKGFRKEVISGLAFTG